MKTEVYSWRVSTEIKTSLERAARRRKVSLSKVLDMAAQEWLKSSGSEGGDDETQRRLHKAAAGCFGCFGSMASGDTRRSETASATVRQRLRRRYGR
jgi:hypothetical protein